MKKTIAIILSLFFLFGCGDINNCSGDSSQSFMIVTFFDSETKQAKEVGFRITNENNDNQILTSDSLSVELALDPMDTSMIFLFDSDTNDYTLIVRYNPEFSIFDPKCDPSLLFVGLDTLESSFDSTAIRGTITDRQLTSNFEVYF